MNKSSQLSLLMATLLPMLVSGHAYADLYDEKLEFAGTLEETLGHFWALEMNLDENNAELALVHATHPIAELYDTMSSHLEDNPKFDAKLQDTLMQLQHKANTKVSREDAQSAINEAKDIIEEARMIVVGESLSDDVAFKAQLINGLLETSKVEYMEAISDGIIEEMAEFQDGSAFVWRSEQILDTLEGIIDIETTNTARENYEAVWNGYNQRADPSEISELVDAIIEEIETISGIESEESKHMEEVFGPKSPLQQIKSGTAPSDVECKSGMELVLSNHDGKAACVSPSGVDKLESIGWGTRA